MEQHGPRTAWEEYLYKRMFTTDAAGNPLEERAFDDAHAAVAEQDMPSKCTACKKAIENWHEHVTYENDYGCHWHGYEVKCPHCKETFWSWEHNDTDTIWLSGSFSGPNLGLDEEFLCNIQDE